MKLEDKHYKGLKLLSQIILEEKNAAINNRPLSKMEEKGVEFTLGNIVSISCGDGEGSMEFITDSQEEVDDPTKRNKDVFAAISKKYDNLIAIFTKYLTDLDHKPLQKYLENLLKK